MLDSLSLSAELLPWLECALLTSSWLVALNDSRDNILHPFPSIPTIQLFQVKLRPLSITAQFHLFYQEVSWRIGVNAIYESTNICWPRLLQELYSPDIISHRDYPDQMRNVCTCLFFVYLSLFLFVFVIVSFFYSLLFLFVFVKVLICICHCFYLYLSLFLFVFVIVFICICLEEHCSDLGDRVSN